MKQKVEIMSMTDEILSPITKASNVLLEDGSNVQQLIDNYVEPEFTPTIETSSSMSKVGQGDNVDFSANVINGAYESCVLKGKTLVNYNAEGNDRNEYVCMPSVEGQNVTLNGTVEGLVKSAILKGQTLVNICKPFEFDIQTTGSGLRHIHNKNNAFNIPIQDDKQYSIWIEIDINEIGPFSLSHTGAVATLAFDPITDLTLTGGSVVAYPCVKRKNSNNTIFTIGAMPGSTEGRLKGRIMVFEGDIRGFELSYFTGMQSVKMPVLTTGTSRNMWSKANDSGETYAGYRRLSKLKIPVFEGETIYIRATGGAGYSGVVTYDENGEKIKDLLAIIGDVMENTYIVEKGVKYIAPAPHQRYVFSENETIMYNRGSGYLPYEENVSGDYKSNILSCNEEVELRGIGEVQDTLDCLTGELTENFIWLNFNGVSKNFKVENSIQTDVNTGYTRIWVRHINDTINNTSILGKNTLNTLLPSFNVEYHASTAPCECIACRANGSGLNIIIKTERLGVVNHVGFVQWLEENMPPILCQLKKSAVKTVDLSDNHVYSYKDVTHYDCSSAEGSLVPTLSIEEGVKYQAFIKPSTKYSIVFNRTLASDSLTVDLGGATASITSSTLGKTIVQITTLPTLSHSYVKFLGVGNTIKDVQVIEGDVVGDEPYFEGMIDAENPVVTNCNMLDVDSVDYKSNTISTNEVVLRSLPNGVYDTLHLMTGEYVQRIGEVVLNSETNITSLLERMNTVRFWVNDNRVPKDVKMLSNKLIQRDVWTTDQTGLQASTNSVGQFVVSIAKNLLEEISIDSIKKFFDENEYTVVFNLETPITTIIDIKQHPYAYKDGYINLSSNSENSLTPTIEYSLPINRSGQVTINTQLVQKQQKQLDELESMIIANMVNTQYKQTLSSVEYMLGGE